MDDNLGTPSDLTLFRTTLKTITPTLYRLGPVNSKSFVGHFFLRIKWIFELNILFNSNYWENFELGFSLN